MCFNSFMLLLFPFNSCLNTQEKMLDEFQKEIHIDFWSGNEAILEF